MPKLEDIERGLVACKVHDDDVRWMAEIIQREIREALWERTLEALKESVKELQERGVV